MFRISSRSEDKSAIPPPPGVTEFIFCVFDEKHHVRHHFQAICPADEEEDHFLLLNVPESAFDSCVLSEAVATRQPASIALSYGQGQRKYLHVLPYERKRGKWRYACLQISTEAPDMDSAIPAWVGALADDRVCFLLVDANNTIQAASSEIPEVFGYTSDALSGLNMSDLFSGLDLSMIDSCLPDTNDPVLGSVLRCLDGSHRDVELIKYSAADHYTLYGICDVTRPQLNEEIALVSTRERRRIGQDLHDSIGQLLTGISLLSRSLSNNLRRDGNPGEEDAAQISELADDASNQIRQISRGLMPADIVERGFFDSLRDLARITTDSCGVLCEVRLDEIVDFNDGAVETHLYRIAQEAVNNAVRHADASRIEIIFSVEDGRPQLRICDDGSWKQAADHLSGIGMKTMHYRASVIGGNLSVGAVDEGGTHVVCRLEADELFETKAV